MLPSCIPKLQECRTALTLDIASISCVRDLAFKYQCDLPVQTSLLCAMTRARAGGRAQGEGKMYVHLCAAFTPVPSPSWAINVSNIFRYSSAQKS